MSQRSGLAHSERDSRTKCSWSATQSYERDRNAFSTRQFQVKIAALRSDRGATAVEYGLMVALIAIVIIAAVTLLGGNLSKLFSSVATSV
jgi:pilus assembly protein Flp/PilA